MRVTIYLRGLKFNSNDFGLTIIFITSEKDVRFILFEFVQESTWLLTN